MSVLIVSDDPVWYRSAPTTLTTSVIPGSPERLQVSDDHGVVATLTVGAKTVTTRGPERVFRDAKRPFADEFQRTSSGDWGISPGGGNWSRSGGSESDYYTEGGAGVIAMTSANSSRYTSVIDNVTDADATATFTMDRMPTGNAASLALLLSYQSSSNHYRARLSVLTSGEVRLTLEKEIESSTTTLAAAVSLGTGFTPGDLWNIRAERAGSTVRCKAWREGESQPAAWTHSVTDTSLGAGRVGFRGFLSSGSTALPLRFLVSRLAVHSALWPDPPTVTHSTWVRLLDTPFSGDWTPELADQIRAWAVDVSPDALAYGAMYLAYAPAVLDASTGAPVFGQSAYGPLDATSGVPREGGDFHEYMGVPWTFANGEHVPAPSAAWIRTFDCSGFIRMILGYHMGVPMVRDEDFDGLNLPRRTRDIGPHGPGVIVAQTTDSPTPLTEAQIGDVVLFDADSADPGEIDHDGMLIGWDAHGLPRFLNSRKTPNGVTFGDLGGSGALVGDGLYARSLRIIRRV
ncbi:hypothetical protein ABZ348_30955 [Streptomyces sp. NPDC005963]|uniref:hypothetical protein n=1 Tax=Streptomyces sp. NPDC005963 TaxID=3156721 RepID=UPI0033F8A62F